MAAPAAVPPTVLLESAADDEHAVVGVPEAGGLRGIQADQVTLDDVLTRSRVADLHSDQVIGYDDAVAGRSAADGILPGAAIDLHSAVVVAQPSVAVGVGADRVPLDDDAGDTGPGDPDAPFAVGRDDVAGAAGRAADRHLRRIVAADAPVADQHTAVGVPQCVVPFGATPIRFPWIVSLIESMPRKVTPPWLFPEITLPARRRRPDVGDVVHIDSPECIPESGIAVGVRADVIALNCVT